VLDIGERIAERDVTQSTGTRGKSIDGRRPSWQAKNKRINTGKRKIEQEDADEQGRADQVEVLKFGFYWQLSHGRSGYRL
jgi:hypothetical protein